MHAIVGSPLAAGAHSPIAVNAMHQVELGQAVHPAVVALAMPAAALAQLPAQLAGLPARVRQLDARSAIGTAAAALGITGIATGVIVLIGTKIHASMDKDYFAHLPDYNHASTITSILMGTGVGVAAAGFALLASATSGRAEEAEDPAPVAEDAAPVAPTAPTTPSHGVDHGAV